MAGKKKKIFMARIFS